MGETKHSTLADFLLDGFLLAVLYILEKESEDFASCAFPSGFFVVHDASWGGEHEESVKTQTGSSAARAAETHAKAPGDNEAGNCSTAQLQQVGCHVDTTKLDGIQIKGGDVTLF